MVHGANMIFKMDRREFIQKSGIAILGAAGGALCALPATAENQSKGVDPRDIEHWLLETGQRALDRDAYSIAARR